MGRHSQNVGTRGELFILGKLLERGLDIYTPVYDTENIDCVVRHENGEYTEIQVKTRSSYEQGNFQLKDYKPRKNFFIILHFLGTQKFWVIPSTDFKKIGNTQYNKKYKTNIVRLNISKHNEYKFQQYYQNLFLIEPKLREEITKQTNKKELQIQGTTKGKTYYAIFKNLKTIELNGKQYKSPSGAARTLTKYPIDGWHFWKFQDPTTGQLIPINTLRKNKKQI